MAFNFATPAPQQQPSLFGQSSPMPSFQQTGFQFQQPQQQQMPQIQFPQQLAQQQQQPQQQMLLCTKDGTAVGYHTKFEELHPDSQKLMFQIQERINEYKDESHRLDQCSRLYDSSVSSDSFEVEASRIIQELGGISTAMHKEKASIEELMDVAKKMLWTTESCIRSYMMLRSRFSRPNVTTSSSIGTSNQLTGNSTTTNQPITSSLTPVSDFYYGVPSRPSPFMQQTVARFEKYLTECSQRIEELEQLLLVDNDRFASNSTGSSLQSIPNIMSNVHDFFIHVAAKVENLHQYIESMKAAYLANQRRWGDGNDPFLEADRREIAKQEAAARRVHPTLHLPAVPAQPSTQGAGLFASSATTISSVPQQPGSSAASTSGFSIFSTPSSAAAASTSSFLFSTPTASTPSLSVFGSSSFTPQSTPFGTASTSLFGSAQTPSLVGASTPSFTPAATGSSLFSTPVVASGTVMGSGASFGAASRSSKPKTRATRR
ncbi:putative nucleoporin p58/p45 [Dioscorea sansibarensis]